MKRICIFLALTLPLAAQDAAQTSGRIQESLNRRALQEQVSDRRTGSALPEGFKTEEDKADEEAPTAEERKPILPLKRLEFGSTRVLPESLLAELRGNIKSLWQTAPSWLDTAEFFAFFDCGQLKHKTESLAISSASEAFLSSTGCGLLNHLNASFTMAMPLKKHTYNLRDNKPHWLFAVSAEF